MLYKYQIHRFTCYAALREEVHDTDAKSDQPIYVNRESRKPTTGVLRLRHFSVIGWRDEMIQGSFEIGRMAL